MDFEFSSKEELYLRVKPALFAKVSELERIGYSSITSIDIWNYMIQNKWKNGEGLMLSDIVDDILNTDCSLIYNYCEDLKEKKDMQNFENNLDLL
ncbi:MAG: hypothetical protein IKE70_02280 [Bacilli bacterium]|nr:hypothetical protein [Bacilli bacterium]